MQVEPGNAPEGCDNANSTPGYTIVILDQGGYALYNTLNMYFMAIFFKILPCTVIGTVRLVVSDSS